MPSTPLYYQSSSLSFAARVVATDGQKVALDQTAFYPEGGGQNADVGWLAWENHEIAVIDTQKEKATGLIWHSVAGEPPAVGTEITGRVDAAARWQGQQRHSAEHLLAAAFYHLNPKFAVVAVGMRSPECTIDLLGEPSEEDLQKVQALLWEVLGRRPLRLRVAEVAEDSLHEYPLRRETKVRGQVRLVIFETVATDDEPIFAPFDVSACGGLHVPWAAQVLPVVTLRSERSKGATRITFMAGEEAAVYLSSVYRQARTLAQDFSTGVDALPERVHALREQLSQERLQVELLRLELAVLRVGALPSERLGPQNIAVRFLRLADNEAAWWTQALKAVPAGEVLVVTTEAGRCAVVSACDISAVEVLRGALTQVGGKGGGKADMAQGQCQDAEAFVAAVRELLVNQT